MAQICCGHLDSSCDKEVDINITFTPTLTATEHRSSYRIVHIFAMTNCPLWNLNPWIHYLFREMQVEHGVFGGSAVNSRFLWRVRKATKYPEVLLVLICSLTAILWRFEFLLMNFTVKSSGRIGYIWCKFHNCTIYLELITNMPYSGSYWN